MCFFLNMGLAFLLLLPEKGIPFGEPQSSNHIKSSFSGGAVAVTISDEFLGDSPPESDHIYQVTTFRVDWAGSNLTNHVSLPVVFSPGYTTSCT